MSMSYRKVNIDFFKENPHQGGLSEEYSPNQDMPEFAVVAPNGIQIGPWMRCKDYVQDIWWGHAKKKAYNCHGFPYNPNVDPAPSKRYLLLAMRWKGKEHQMPTMLDNIKRTVESIETKLKIQSHIKTRFSRAQGDMFVVYGSPKYLQSIKLVTFFTWILRASFKNTGGRLDTLKDTPPVKKDFYYRQNGDSFIKKLFREGIDAVEDDWNKTSVYDCHNQGFVHYSYSIKGSEGVSPGDYLDENGDWGF